MIQRRYVFPGVVEMNYQSRRRLGVNIYLIDGGSEFALIDVGFLAELPDVLAGANTLLQNDVELDGREIVFFSPSGCGDSPLGYWATDVPWVPTEATTSRDLRVNITVLVNGQPVRALIDTGAPMTMLDSGAARRLVVGVQVAVPGGQAEIETLGQRRQHLREVSLAAG